MIIEQMEVGFMDNFSYLVGCEKTGEAMVIDPAGDPAEIVAKADALGLSIVLIVNTHGHGDHTAGNAALKAKTGAQIVIHHLDKAGYPGADRFIKEEATLSVGQITFDIIHTPGHTPGGICLHAEGNLFTGDTLFVGDSGRTDLGGGDRPTLGASIRKLMRFPEETVVWPGHDYGPTPSSTLGWERRHNVNAKEYGYYIAST